jgi:hypothetical protein
LNPRRAIGRNGKPKPMKKRIALKSFSALSFDLIVRQTPVRAMHSPQPTTERRLVLVQGGDQPVEARSPVDSAKADRTETTGHFPHRNRLLVKGRDRAAWRPLTSSAQ